MDETALNELLECSVCLERLDSSSKVLPCQHTFCRRCLEEIVSTKSELRCPECRALVETPVEVLPSNILLIRLLEGLKYASRCSDSGGHNTPTGIGSTNTSPIHIPATAPRHQLAIAVPVTVGTGGTTVSRTSGDTPLHTPNLAQPCAKALYNYDAKEPGDLSFKKGDVVLLKKQVDENWYHGEIDSKHGFFPATYVQVLVALDCPKCKALYDFFITDKNEKDCLTFHKDDIVTVIRRVDDNWAEGKHGDRIGIFPISFVDLNDAAKLLIQTQQSSQANQLNNHLNYTHRALPSITTLSNSASASSSSSSSPSEPTYTNAPTTSVAPVTPTISINNGSRSPSSSESNSPTAGPSSPLHHPAISRSASQKRHSLTTMSPPRLNRRHHRHSMEIPSCVAVSINSMRSVSIVSTASSAVTVASSSCIGSATTCLPSLTVYVALYNYKPQKDDELELHKGEYYSVKEQCQDGWYKGMSLSSRKSGVFPGNYVQSIRITPTKPLIKCSLSSSSPASSPSSPSAVASTCNNLSQESPAVTAVRSHHAVARTHSFPKTSPLVRAGSQVVVPPPNITVPGHTHVPRPITNVTQAQIRQSQVAAALASTAAAAASTSVSTTATTSTAMTPAVLASPHQSAIPGKSHSKSHSLPPGITPPALPHKVGASGEHVRGSPVGGSHSPRSPRRSGDKSKQSNSSSPRNHRRGTGSSPISVPQSSTQARPSAGHGHHHGSGITMGTATLQVAKSPTPTLPAPPSPSLTGATGGISSSETTSLSSNKKRESLLNSKLPASLIKKLAQAGIPLPSRSRRNRSPPDMRGTSSPSSPLASALCAAGSTHTAPLSSPPAVPSPRSHSSHKRTGSLPVENLTGAAASSSPVSVVPVPAPRSSGSSSSRRHHHKKSAPSVETTDSSASASPSAASSSTAGSAEAAAAASVSTSKPAMPKPMSRERFRCIVPYPPQSSLELELKTGDVIFIHKKRDDGWYRGTLQSNGKTGLFPGSFVEKF